MTEPRNDRRSRRTRQALKTALLELMLEQRYETIAVQDIIDRADVGRSTFYAHFKDKEDLFLSGFQDLFDALGRAIEPRPGTAPRIPSLELFRHVQSHYGLYQALARGQGRDLLHRTMLEQLMKLIEERVLQDASVSGPAGVPPPLLANHLAGGLVAMLQWWLDNRMPHSPEQMDTYYQRLVAPVLGAPL